MRKTDCCMGAAMWGFLVIQSFGASALDIGTQKQLFIDDYIVESMEPRVYRLMNQPQKYHNNPVIRLGYGLGT